MCKDTEEQRLIQSLFEKNKELLRRNGFKDEEFIDAVAKRLTENLVLWIEHLGEDEEALKEIMDRTRDELITWVENWHEERKA